LKPSNLVVVRAGKHSLHPTWIDSAGHEAPDFDLLVAAYHEDAMKEDARHATHRFIPGTKVRGWNTVLNDCSDLLHAYQRVALIDDDIRTNAATLNQCFAVGTEHNLSLWQPSLSHDSFATYAASLQNERFLLRHVNCIEMMCPFFKVSTLKKLSRLFTLGFESGIDLVWCSAVREMGGKCAIVDACAVTHTKPVGREKQLNGFVDRTYEDDIHSCLELFNMKWPAWVAESALDKAHTKIDGIALKLSSIAPLLKFYQAPGGNRLDRLKASFDHLRHQALRPPYYGTNVVRRLIP
jgi:hypothetical protein